MLLHSEASLLAPIRLQSPPGYDVRQYQSVLRPATTNNTNDHCTPFSTIGSGYRFDDKLATSSLLKCCRCWWIGCHVIIAIDRCAPTWNVAVSVLSFSA
eukprot:scaffold25360_cov66-Skeletonema_marinoi.AAC.1